MNRLAGMRARYAPVFNRTNDISSFVENVDTARSISDAVIVLKRKKKRERTNRSVDLLSAIDGGSNYYSSASLSEIRNFAKASRIQVKLPAK